MNFVSCVAWVRRGLASGRLDKVTVSEDDLRTLLRENQAEIRDLENGSSLDEEGSDRLEDGEPNLKRARRGDDDDDVVAQYDLDSYDDATDASNALAGLAGLVVFASNNEDEYLTVKEDDDSSDASDELIRPDDNLIAVGHVSGEESILEIYVFNQDAGDLYVHHDYLLQSQPLCAEWLDFDLSEGSESKSNLLAVGSMAPVIDVWDIDTINCLEPAFQLGHKKKKKSKLGHTDAVLDISWNTTMRNLLASGSADHTIALWDLTNGVALSLAQGISEKVQTLEWHSCESQLLLAGCCNGWTGLIDCRHAMKAVQTWTADGEVERVIWNRSNPFCFLVGTDKGFVHHFDSRNSKPLWTLSAHHEACTGLCLSSSQSNALATASTDGTLKLWDIGQSAPTCVTEKSLNVGKTMCLQASPDSSFTFCFGGDKRSKCFDVLDLGTSPEIESHFADTS